MPVIWHDTVSQQAGVRALDCLLHDAQKCWIIIVSFKDRHPRIRTVQNVTDEVLLSGSFGASPNSRVPNDTCRNSRVPNDTCRVQKRFLTPFPAIGDVASATAILDRFLHHAELIQITGRSYRLGNREKGPTYTKAPTGSTADEKGRC